MDQVPAPFCQSLAQIQKTGECVLAMKSGSLIYTSRNDLATQAIQIEADYVMWFDSDMVFKPDTMVRMLDTMQKNDIDILTGLYFRRVPPYSPVLFDKLEMRGEACLWSEFKTIPEGLFEVGGCGFGCVLMKTDVFFDVQSRFGNMFAPIANTGEDLAFCWRARNCGYKIVCDPSIICGHVGYSVVDDQFFKVFGAAK
jgi:GT2 family glycosyltransferase